MADCFELYLQPLEIRLEVKSTETLLGAIQRNGYWMRQACRNGVCELCQGKLLDGVVELRNDQVVAATSPDSSQLICCCTAYPRTNIQLEVATVLGPNELPVQEVSGQIVAVTAVTDNVKQVRIKLPAGKPIRFYAGQYLLIQNLSEEDSAFSIASAPLNNRELELHIGAAPESSSYQALASKLAVGELLKLKLPFGVATVNRLKTYDRLVLIAAGTGFSQIKSVLESLINDQDSRPVSVYWGARTAAGLYLNDYITELAKQQENLTYIPVVSEDPGWSGALGLVHQKVLADLSSFENTGVLCSGSPPMVYTVLDDFVAAGMDASQMYSDVFEYAPREG